MAIAGGRPRAGSTLRRTPRSRRWPARATIAGTTTPTCAKPSPRSTGSRSAAERSDASCASLACHRREPTQVARALEQLGIQLVLAHSPQAKGRIERCWGTLQDRLVKALRRAGACTIEEANAGLCAYISWHNTRFAVPPADRADAH